ncbi:large subunit ribosomal protein L21 [Bogoriella caseilytica]|uniref:Large ribosomal subunit protein bL21 n=2 Tax=Bogoriella caseilytica TaxID=56055 RepID=A0A3N2B9F5_9MICO|nr:large subunit ribosomal protein L21 [Bogoriella caseilytica]
MERWYQVTVNHRMTDSPSTEMSSNVVYAIVKAGGRQEKVSVGDILVVDRLDGKPGETVELQPVMLVDGEKVTTGGDVKATVTAEIVRAEKGPKINIMKFKNKTGYRRRQGYRSSLTRLKVTGIN